MIFLYRFELLKLDGALADRAPTDYTEAQIPGRELVLHTNYERTLSFASEPFKPSFLPNGLTPPDGGWVFTPAAIDHDGFRLDAEKAAGQIKVSLPIDHPLAVRYANEDAGAQLWLTLATIENEQDTSPLVVWVGRLRTAEYDESRCSLTLMHIGDTLNRPGLTRKHPRQCPYALFDRATCGIDANAYDSTASYWKFREDGFVQSVGNDRMTIVVPEAANRSGTFFTGGFVVIEGDYSTDEGTGTSLHKPRTAGLTATQAAKSFVNGGIRRSIAEQSGTTLTLITPLLTNIAPGAKVSVYAGCSKLPDGADGCKVKFINFPRYGGYPYIPVKNPFESGIN